MGQDSLVDYFRTNFALMQFHKWSLNEVENMVPWERYIYVDLLEAHLKEEEALERSMRPGGGTVSRVNMQPAKQRFR